MQILKAAKVATPVQGAADAVQIETSTRMIVGGTQSSQDACDCHLPRVCNSVKIIHRRRGFGAATSLTNLHRH